MSVDLSAIRDRWGAAAAGFIDFARVDRGTLEDKLAGAINDLDGLTREVERLRSVITTGGAMYRAERSVLGVGVGGRDPFDDELAELREIAAVVRAAGNAEDADDATFDAASDALWAMARKVAGKPPREGVSQKVEAIDG